MTTTYPAGSVIAGYRLVELHATGGMGSVYRAIEVATGRQVALKLSRFPDSVANERAALTAATSPHVVGYIGSGTTPDGTHYVVVEWLEGEDLRGVIARGSLAIDRAVRIAIELCEALAEVHAAGFVHRDVKPGNVIVTARGVTLLDFGLALPAGVTRPSLHGTADYLAPELVAGPRAVADPRGDVYALGCVMFELLTGTTPFETGTAAHTLLRRLLEPAPRLRASRAEVPSWLDELVARMLRREPSERPHDGAEALALLRTPDRDATPFVLRATPEPHSHAFALVRAGAATSDATIELADHAVVDELATTCREFGIRADAPLDVLVLTASDHDPRDQLRRLVGAALRLIDRRAELRIAIVTGGDAARSALARGYALLDAAPAGTALADDETRRLVPADCAELAPVAPSVFRVTAAAARMTREPLVDRDAIVRRLRELARSASFAIVFGDAGMGKTAVLDAVRDAHATPHASLVGHLHLAHVPFHGLHTWLAAELARLGITDEAALRDELVRRLGRRGALRARELARLILAPGDSGRAPADGSRDALEGAIDDGLRAFAPELLFVDDAQWLDAASAAALVRLLGQATHPAVILAARPALRGLYPELVACATAVETLGALGAAGVAELIARIAPGIEPAASSAIVRDAEGHPLIAIELARAAAAGDLERAPATALGLVQARLLRLSAAAKRAVSAAALLGGNVSHELLARVLGEDRPDATTELTTAGILVPDAADMRSLRFATALVAEAADALVPASERVALHAAIARHLALDPATEPAVLLRHATAANDDELVTLAHVLAAERAVVLFDFETAREAARDAIATGASGELFARARLCEAEALLAIERYTEADVRAREAAEHVRRGSLRWSYAAAIRTRVVHRRLVPEAAMALFDELAAIPDDDRAAARVRLQCLIHIAGNLVLVGHLAAGDARGDIVEAMAAREPLTPELEAELHRLRGRRAAAIGDWDRYRIECERGAEIHERSGNPLNAALSLINVSHAWFELGEVEHAVAMGKRLVAEITELDVPYVLGYARFMLGFNLRRAGEPDAARIELLRALEDSEEEPRRAGEIAVELALDALDRAVLDEAARHADRAIVLLAPAPAHLAQVNAVRAAVHLSAGELAEATACVERARAAAAPLGVMAEELSFVRLVELEVGAATHDARLPERAVAALAELDDRERRLGRPELALRFRARADHARLRDLATSLVRRPTPPANEV